MKWNDQQHLVLESEEVELLLWSVPNEVTNGFAIKDFEKTIGISKERATNLFKDLRDKPKGDRITLDRHQALIFHNALAAVLEELGVEEFQTRTGCDFEAGHTMLRELSHFLQQTGPS